MRSRNPMGAAGVAALLLLLGCQPGSSGEFGPAEADPGRVTLHRLNRAEYNNTVRDLLGAEIRPADDFPTDHHSFGFDNIADGLTLAPALFELYERAAEALVDEALLTHSEHVFVCDPDLEDARGCAEAILEQLVPRAWRRPVHRAELDELMALFDGSDDSFDDRIALVLKAVLLSPHFIYRVERDGDEPGPHPLDDYELASRLSYFLWSSMPDDELFAAAGAGRLYHPDELETQVRRMLADPRARAWIDDFAGQWLAIRGLDDTIKDAYTYPAFDDGLRLAMREEMTLFVQSLLDDDAPLQSLLTADYTFIDHRLAPLYGFPPPESDGFHRVSLVGKPRRGVLTQAGLLSVLAYPFATSVVQRGHWVLDQMLCVPLGAPPDGVEISVPTMPSTKREQAEQRAGDPACAGCHAAIDPIGFAFEHYDAIGYYRETEEGEPIVTAGALPSGETFDDALDLAEILAADPAFVRCTVEHALTYALGRGLEPSDAVYVDGMVEALHERDDRIQELLILIAQSEPFRMRRREGE